jgi:hypothetical protein
VAFQVLRRGQDLGQCYATLSTSPMNPDFNHNFGILDVRDPRLATWKSHADADAALCSETVKD